MRAIAFAVMFLAFALMEGRYSRMSTGVSDFHALCMIVFFLGFWVCILLEGWR